jgi:hypothetical protein
MLLLSGHREKPGNFQNNPQKDGSQRVLNRDCRADDDSSSCLAELFKFVVLTSLMSAHTALNRLWHLSPRIPLTRFLQCPKKSLAMTLLAEVCNLHFLSHVLPTVLIGTARLPTFLPLGRRRLADDDSLKHKVREELRRFSRGLRYRHTSSHAKVEKVC